MDGFQFSYNSLPDDLALKIASSLQVTDLCSLGSCSRFWRELCASDHIWESLVRKRWPLLGFSKGESTLSTRFEKHGTDENSQEWKRFYMIQHSEMAARASNVIIFVKECSALNSLESGDYLKAIEVMSSMQLAFQDVEMFLFKPNLNVLLNLIGLHYCILLLKEPGERIVDALARCKISEQRVWVKWWTLGRWSRGFRMRDGTTTRQVSLMDLATGKEETILRVLRRGVLHEVLRVCISVPNPTCSPSTSSSSSIRNYSPY